MMFRTLLVSALIAGATNAQEGCSVCGDGLMVTNPDAIFAFPGQPAVTCRNLELAGESGQIPLSDCGFLPTLIEGDCQCMPAVAPTPAPVLAPTPAPILAPTPAPVTAPTGPAPTRGPIDDGECVCYKGGDPVPIQNRQLNAKSKGVRRNLREVREEKLQREALQVLRGDRKLSDTSGKNSGGKNSGKNGGDDDDDGSGGKNSGKNSGKNGGDDDDDGDHDDEDCECHEVCEGDDVRNSKCVLS
jgi:hypothetical protein